MYREERQLQRACIERRDRLIYLLKRTGEQVGLQTGRKGYLRGMYVYLIT